jgi:vitamin B12 transporter
MKKHYLVAASLGFAQLALFSTVAKAQEQPVNTLDEVVVTASRSPRKQADVGRVVRVISSQQLEKSLGRTLPEVLNNVAGISLSGAGNNLGTNISTFTRGATAGNTLILIDGIPANNASGITGEYDLNAFAIDQIERIEILRGVNSTLYGSDAVAGVINIITKKPAADKLKANVLLTGGSYDTYRQGLGLNGSIGTTGVSFNFTNTSSGGFSIAKDKTGTGNFDKDGFNQQMFTTDLKQAFSDKFSLSARFQGGQNKFDLDGGAFADDNNYTAKNNSFFAGLDGKYLLPKGDLTFIANQNTVINDFYNPGTGNQFAKQHNVGNITYLESIVNQQLASNLNLVGGVNFRHTASNQTYESISSFGPFNSYLPSKTNNIISTYADLFLKVSGFNIDLGGRYNNHSIYGSNGTYTINPSYVIANRYKIFASLASGYKVPSIYQLNSQYGNLNLKPENSTTYEAGVDLELLPSKVNFSASFFKRDIKDLIYFYSDPVTFASQYRNGFEQKDKGFELELTTNPIEKLNFNAWYAFVEGKGQSSTGAAIDYLLRRPKNTFGANAGYQISNAVSFNVIYKYTAARLDPFYDSTIFSTVNINQAAFSTFDTYLQVKPAASLTIFADVKNIFDEKYTEWQGYNTKGRNFNAGLKYDIK